MRIIDKHFDVMYWAPHEHREYWAVGLMLLTAFNQIQWKRGQAPIGWSEKN